MIVRTPGGIIRVFKNRDEFESGKKIDGEAISWYQMFNRNKGAVTRVQISPTAVDGEIATAVAASITAQVAAGSRPRLTREMDGHADDMAAAEARYDSEDMAVASPSRCPLSTSGSRKRRSPCLHRCSVRRMHLSI